MSQYGWMNCPTATRTQIGTFLDRVRTILRENLVGVYLHGSLAMGCFNPKRSDIDLLVVTEQGMTIETKREIAELLLSSSLAPSPIEISFLVEQDMRPFHHPLPFDMHYSEFWRARYMQALAGGTWRTWNDETRKDQDLAAHLTILYARGICLYGKPIQGVFPPIPPASYAASIIGDFGEANEGRTTMPIYFVLNACRVLAFLLEDHIYSKDEGGSWGLQTLPTEFRGVVAQALDIYRGNRLETPFDEVALAQFSDYTKKRINALR